MRISLIAIFYVNIGLQVCLLIPVGDDAKFLMAGCCC